MARRDPYRPLLELPQEELERKVALLYEEGLLALQEKMHPGSVRSTDRAGIVVHGPSGGPQRPGAGESPEELARHGRKVVMAMMGPVQERVCEDYRHNPGLFRDASSAVPRILRHLTRVSPPDELFVAAACLLLRDGIGKFCSSEGARS